MGQLSRYPHPDFRNGEPFDADQVDANFQAIQNAHNDTDLTLANHVANAAIHGGGTAGGAHASTHAAGGTDALTPAAIGAAPASHTHANLPTTEQKAALGGTQGAPSDTNRFVTSIDPRNTNARAPTAHRGTHAAGGADALTPADIGAQAKNPNGSITLQGPLPGNGANVTTQGDIHTPAGSAWYGGAYDGASGDRIRHLTERAWELYVRGRQWLRAAYGGVVVTGDLTLNKWTDPNGVPVGGALIFPDGSAMTTATTASGLPTGGAAGQVLKKASATDGHVTWGDDLQGTGGSGTSTAQFDAKAYGAKGDVKTILNANVADNLTAVVTGPVGTFKTDGTEVGKVVGLTNDDVLLATITAVSADGVSLTLNKPSPITGTKLTLTIGGWGQQTPRTYIDVTATAGSTTLTRAGGGFLAGDVNASIWMGLLHTTTIASIQSSAQATLTHVPGATRGNLRLTWGTDDSVALRKVRDAAIADGIFGAKVWFPKGRYFTEQFDPKWGIVYEGDGAEIIRLPNRGMYASATAGQYLFQSHRTISAGSNPGTAWDQHYDSPYLEFRNLTVSGNRHQQGPYHLYQQEQSHAIALQAGASSATGGFKKGRLRVIMHNIKAEHSPADGLQVSTNVQLTFDGFYSFDTWRGGLVPTGGWSSIKGVNCFLGGHGEEFPGRMDLEMDGFGYSAHGGCEMDITNFYITGDTDWAAPNGGMDMKITNYKSGGRYTNIVFSGGSKLQLTNFSLSAGWESLIKNPSDVQLTNGQFVVRRDAKDDGWAARARPYYGMLLTMDAVEDRYFNVDGTTVMHGSPKRLKMTNVDVVTEVGRGTTLLRAYPAGQGFVQVRDIEGFRTGDTIIVGGESTTITEMQYGNQYLYISPTLTAKAQGAEVRGPRHFYPGDSLVAFSTTSDKPDLAANGNTVEWDGGRIDPIFDVGMDMLAGGNWDVRLDNYAKTAYRLAGQAGAPAIVHLRGGKVSPTAAYLRLVGDHADNVVIHSDTVHTPAENKLVGIANTTATKFRGGRTLVGSALPDATTPGLPHDRFELDAIPATGDWRRVCHAGSAGGTGGTTGWRNP